MTRRLVFSPVAERDLNRHIDYLIDQHAIVAAEQLNQRVAAFLSMTLSAYPRTGRLAKEPDLWESWIPGTKLIVWYEFTDEELNVVRFWHTAQQRQTDKTDDDQN